MKTKARACNTGSRSLLRACKLSLAGSQKILANAPESQLNESENEMPRLCTMLKRLEAANNAYIDTVDCLLWQLDEINRIVNEELHNEDLRNMALRSVKSQYDTERSEARKSHISHIVMACRKARPSMAETNAAEARSREMFGEDAYTEEHWRAAQSSLYSDSLMLFGIVNALAEVGAK